MLDHISFSVNDYQQSVKFYDATLQELGIERLMAFDEGGQQVAGYGVGDKPCFWIGVDARPNQQGYIGQARGLHVAFQAPNPEAIQAWYKKCLELGGKDNGAPGRRPEYHPGYYSAFIIDPNGWRIEAVMHNYT